LIVCVVLSCDSKPAATEKPLPVIEKSGPGVIRGKVTFDGEPPVMAKINNSICHGAKEIFEETAIVGSGGGLKNAIVYVGGVRGPMDKTPEPAVLDQLNCQFVPHVVAVRIGQALKVVNSDHEMHNVGSNSSANPPFNKGFMGPGEQQMSFAKAETFKVKCDVHPWMIGYIGVFDSGYFAVTGDDGSFQIAGLPPGTYDLHVWHERYGEQNQSVKVESGAAEANFKFTPQ
jgi:plastocyanin